MENNPTYLMILSELARLNTLANLQTEDEVLQLKAELLAEELEAIDLEDIRGALRAHGRHNNWLPTLKQILEGVDLIREERRRQTKALPMPPELTDEQIALNLARIKELKTALGWSMKMPDKPTINSVEKLQAQLKQLMKQQGREGKSNE